MESDIPQFICIHSWGTHMVVGGNGLYVECEFKTSYDEAVITYDGAKLYLSWCVQTAPSNILELIPDDEKRKIKDIATAVWLLTTSDEGITKELNS